MKLVATYICGLIFGIGLVVSGLSNPAKVLAFLDIAGVWDPSLAFTMGGAVLTTYFGYRFVLGSAHPLFAERFQMPTARDIDTRLVTGAAMFGVGWGLVGYCPGPAVMALTLGHSQTYIFFAAMLAGMLLGRWLTSGTPSLATT